MKYRNTSPKKISLGSNKYEFSFLLNDKEIKKGNLELEFATLGTLINKIFKKNNYYVDYITDENFKELKDYNALAPNKIYIHVKPKLSIPPKYILNILDDIRQIEGPVSFYVLKPKDEINQILNRNSPVILLLGDYHQNRTGCETCEQNKCQSLYQKNGIIPFLKFIDKKTDNKNIKTDLFLESWFMKIKDTSLCSPNLNQEESSIYDVVKQTACCVSRKVEGCQYSRNIRFHMVDVRLNLPEGDDKENFADTIINEITNLLKTKEEKKLVLKIQSFLNRFREKYSKQVMIFLTRVIMDNMNIEKYMENPFVVKNSLIYKEINQLDEQIKRKIYNNVKKTQELNLKESIKDFLSIIKEKDLLKYITNLVKLNELTRDMIRNNFHKLSISLVDVYTISRILKTPKYNGVPSNLSIVYIGDSHVKNINDILVKSDFYEVEKYHVPEEQMLIEDDMNMLKFNPNFKKCIKIKEEKDSCTIS